MRDQDGWIALPSPFSPDAATITNAKVKSGKQSVVVPGISLNSQDGNDLDPYDAVGIYRRPVNFDTASGNNKWARVDADLMLETSKPKTKGEFFSLTISARAIDGGLGEISLSSAGVVEAFAYNAPPGGAPLANCSRAIGFNKWHHITLLHDFVRRVTSYFIDEHFLCAAPAPRTSTVLQRGSMGIFARPDGDPLTGPNSVRSDYTARYDNFRISVHSEAPDID